MFRHLQRQAKAILIDLSRSLVLYQNQRRDKLVLSSKRTLSLDCYMPHNFYTIIINFFLFTTLFNILLFYIQLVDGFEKNCKPICINRELKLTSYHSNEMFLFNKTYIFQLLQPVN